MPPEKSVGALLMPLTVYAKIFRADSQ